MKMGAFYFLFYNGKIVYYVYIINCKIYKYV